MHARVIRATLPEGAMGAGLEGIRTITVPAVKQMPGNKGGYWFANRESRRVIGTVFFESKETLEASRDAAAALRNETMARSGAQLAGVEEYEVIANTGEKVSTTAKYGRLTFVEGDPSTVDAAIEQVRTQVIPALQNLDGYSGGVWLTDRTAGTGIAISLWESEEAMKASAEAAAALRTNATQAAQQQVIGVEEGEIGARAETD